MGTIIKEKFKKLYGNEVVKLPSRILKDNIKKYATSLMLSYELMFIKLI